jgi:hypothetical protein
MRLLFAYRSCAGVKASISSSVLRCLDEIHQLSISDSLCPTRAWPLDTRVKGKFDPNAAGLQHDEMDLRSLARELWSEFHNHSRPAGNAFVQGIQSRAIGDCESQMMKADVFAPVECDRFVRRFYLPQGDSVVAVRDECRGIFRPLANDPPTQAIAEEAASALEVSDA